MRLSKRRILGLILVVTGAVLLWLAPETEIGLYLLVVAVAVELLGILLEKRRL